MEKPMKNVRLGNLLSGSNFNIFAFLTRYTKFWPSEKICAENGPKRLKYYIHIEPKPIKNKLQKLMNIELSKLSLFWIWAIKKKVVQLIHFPLFDKEI